MTHPGRREREESFEDMRVALEAEKRRREEAEKREQAARQEAERMKQAAAAALAALRSGS